MEPQTNDDSPTNELARRWRTARQVFREQGLRGMLARGPRSVVTVGWWGLTRLFNRRATFVLDDRSYTYRLEVYNQTYFNERTVEVPIAIAAVLQCDGLVLEVGNVLGHYGLTGHTVADKYEAGPGVLNVDVLDLDVDERFDLIVSVSTLEHVGLEEEVRDPGKPMRAIAHLVSLLKPGGRLLVTVPVGYNPALDAWLLSDEPSFDSLRFLGRRALNRWVEVTPAEAARALYDWRWMRAACVAVGTVTV